MSIKIIHNVETNEILEATISEEELNNAKTIAEEIEFERIEKANAKAALLEKLGITENEAKLLLS